MPCTSSGLWLENLWYKGFCVQGSLKQNVANSQDHCSAEQLPIFYFTLPLNLICSCCNTLPKKLNHFLLITDSDIISIRVLHSTMPGRDAVGKNKLLCFKNVHGVTTSCSEKKNLFFFSLSLFPERSLYLKSLTQQTRVSITRVWKSGLTFLGFKHTVPEHFAFQIRGSAMKPPTLRAQLVSTALATFKLHWTL